MFNIKSFHKPNLLQISNSTHTIFQQCTHVLSSMRGLRTHLKPTSTYNKIYTLNNKILMKNWPPPNQIGNPITHTRCRETLYHLEQLEKEKLIKQRRFFMPYIKLGDLVEVRYELSRTNQTFAVFQGYCVDFTHKGVNSSFCLKNNYDGVGVEQRIPLFSPRLLNVRVVKSLKTPLILNKTTPFTRDYRYKWQHFVRHKFERKIGKHKPGIRSIEPRLRRRIQKISRRYMRQRISAGLPPYVWEGPYNILSRRRSRLIRAERYRRMQIYSYDTERLRAQKLRKRRLRHRWGNYKIKMSKNGTTALNELPKDHQLLNLPK